MEGLATSSENYLKSQLETSECLLSKTIEAFPAINFKTVIKNDKLL